MSVLYALAACAALILVSIVVVRRLRGRRVSTDGFSFVAKKDARTVGFGCGHAGPDEIVYEVYGVKIKGQFAQGSPNCPECCLKQMRQLIIRCAVCGRPIMPGAVVHLYSSVPSAKPEWTTRHAGELVLCNHADCEGGNPCGRWNGETVEEFDFGS